MSDGPMADETALCEKCGYYVPRGNIMRWTDRQRNEGVCIECWSGGEP